MATYTEPKFKTTYVEREAAARRLNERLRSCEIAADFRAFYGEMREEEVSLCVRRSYKECFAVNASESLCGDYVTYFNDGVMGKCRVKGITRTLRVYPL